MATQPIPVLKETFSDNKEPNGNDFGNLIDSFEHKSIPIEQNRIRGLNQTLAEKASKEDLKNVTTNFKGYHTALTALQTAYPQPQNEKDFFAWVGSPYPGTVYKVFADGGAWTDTGEVPTQQEIDLAEYVKGKTIYNVSQANNKFDYISKQDARNAVPSEMRGRGQILKYLLSNTKTMQIGRDSLIMSNDKAINATTGIVSSAANHMTVEIDVEGYDTINLQCVYSDTYGGVFFNASGNMISGYKFTKEELTEELRTTVNIPNGAVKLINTYITDAFAISRDWLPLNYVILQSGVSGAGEWIEETYIGADVSGWDIEQNWSNRQNEVSVDANYIALHGGAGWQLPLRGLEAAYSFRNLNDMPSMATIRRLSDSNVTSDLSDLDSFQTIGGWSPLVCDELKDQSFNGNDLKPFDNNNKPVLLHRILRSKPAVTTSHYSSSQILRGNKSVSLIGEKTIACVFRATGVIGTDTYGMIVSNYGGLSPYHGWAVGVNKNGNPSYWCSGNSTPFIEDTTRNLIDGALHSIVVTHKGTTLNVYVDGELSIHSDAYNQNTDAYGFLTIGANSDNTPAVRLNGSVGEVLLYSRAWNKNEVLAYVSNLNYYYGIDELLPITNEKSVRTLYRSYINAGQTLTFERAQPWTMYAAVQMLTGCGHAGIIFTNVSANSNPFYGYELFIDQHGRPAVRIINSVTNSWISIFANKSIADGKIHVIGARYDGSSKANGVKIYVDGIEITDRYIEGDNLTGTIIGGTQYLCIGSQYNRFEFYFTGIMDDFRIDNIDRGALYMEAMKRPSLIPVIDANTQIAYDFEGASNVITDISGNGRDGTVNNENNIPFWVE